MKKISLNGISEILSEKELKNVMGGSGFGNGCSRSWVNCGGECFTPYGNGTCNTYLVNYSDPSTWYCACYV